MKMNEKLTFEEVMELLGVKTRQTIYNYIERGLLVPQKAFNNRVYFEQAEVDKLLELNKAVKG
jgi:DNA-binding transcriptional MerR regulator